LSERVMGDDLPSPPKGLGFVSILEIPAKDLAGQGMS